ncbi:MAG TPA: lipid-A-disaccharide synthase [Flavobacterium sp.]|jgi:lipid-A-disaccharide synthase
MKYYIIAGEASGDLHGSNLMKALYAEDPQAEIRFWGGDLMQAVGGTLVKHYKELAFMGFIEVLFNLRTILSNIKICKADIGRFSPDAIIFIDYPGFNMRIAKWAKERKYQTHYYVSPQIWAWKENRISSIKRDVDKMYVILPFEKDFYEKKHGYGVEFVGHPLIDAIQSREHVDADKFRLENNLDNRPIIALLPGSRKQEITKLLHVMLSAVDHFRDYQFVIAGAPGQDDSFYSQFLLNKEVGFVSNRTYDLLDIAYAALVTSGTATLETALFKVPEVVCYKGSWASYQIAKRIITLKYISLVNLILDEPAVTELIQDECNPERIITELKRIVEPEHRAKVLNSYNLLEQKLGGIGASQKVAKLIVDNF